MSLTSSHRHSIISMSIRIIIIIMFIRHISMVIRARIRIIMSIMFDYYSCCYSYSDY